MKYPIFICRHGKTEWNLEKRKQGHLDSSLSDLGKTQAALLANFFQDIEGDELDASDLGRVRETTNYILNKNPKLTPFYTEDLREISFGVLQGKTKTEIEQNQKLNKIISSFQEDPFNYRFPEGESFGDLIVRANRFINQRLLRSLTAPRIIIAHEDINRILIMQLLGLSEEDGINFSQPNNIIYEIEGFNISRINIETNEKVDGILTTN